MARQRGQGKSRSSTAYTRPQTAQEPAAPLLLADLSSRGFEEACADIDLVLLPVGAHEQHGPALPVSTDTITAQVLCALAGALLRPRVAIAPAIPWGVSRHHMGLPGTITLHEETLISIVEDVVTSLADNGISRFLVVNTHGGNNAALHVAAERCHARHGIPIVVAIDGYTLVANAASDILGPEAIGHAGGDEASVVLATRPDLVDVSRLGSPQVNQALRRSQAVVRAARGVLPVAMDRLTPSGATGDSSGANGDAGSAILGRAAGQLRAIAEEVMELDIDAFRRP